MPPAGKNNPESSLAGTASDRVRAIVEAAEAAAAQIRSEAEQEADRIRARAEERASTLRQEVRGDVQALVASIREGIDRLRRDLEQLEQRVGETEPAAEPPGKPPVAAQPEPPAAREAEEDADIALAEDAAVGLDEQQPEGARLVALNMALDGAKRNEVDAYLREHFKLRNTEALLDDVYANVGR
jgi:hypothetical protein